VTYESSQITFLTGYKGVPRMRVLVTALVLAVVGLAVFAGAAASRSNDNVTVTVDTLPISNGLPLDLGIAKGFFNEQGITIKKVTFQSGNDIVLALANHNGDVGYLGYVPMMIARTSGIPLTLLSASEVEGTSAADNWQDILVKGNSSITTPAQLAGKTIAVNALKGVGEVVIKAALQKSGVDPNSVKLLALPFPTMRTALANGQVDAIWTPEPFITQATTLDGARIVMAPGPVLGNHFPNGGYAALHDWMTKNPGTAKKFATAINKSLDYAQSHPDEIRALLPPSQQNIHLAVWTSTIDRPQLLQLAKYAKQYGVINSLPNFTQLFPSAIRSGQATGLLEGSINGSKIGMKTEGVVAKKLDPGKYLLVVTDKSKADNFRLKGPGVNKATQVKGTGTQRWTLTLTPGTYRFSSDAHSKLHGSFRVS
jgi:NitT/TauT family transport system substrate-binding protein